MKKMKGKYSSDKTKGITQKHGPQVAGDEFLIRLSFTHSTLDLQ